VNILLATGMTDCDILIHHEKRL